MVSEEAVAMRLNSGMSALNNNGNASNARSTLGTAERDVPLSAAIYGVQRVESKSATAGRKAIDVPVIQPGPPARFKQHNFGDLKQAAPLSGGGDSAAVAASASCSDDDGELTTAAAGPPAERPPPPPQPQAAEAVYRSLDKHRSRQRQAPPAPPSFDGGESMPTTPRSSRRIYSVEEPPSSHSTTDRRDHRALVRRITNDMHMAQYMEHKKTPSGAADASNAMILAEAAAKKRRRRRKYEVYRLRAFRLAEHGVRRALWYLGKAAAAHKVIFTALPIVFLLLTFVGPAAYRHNLSIAPPFASFVTSLDPIRSFEYGLQQQQRYFGGVAGVNSGVDTASGPAFNGSNPAFSAIRRNSIADFSVLLKTSNPKKSVIEEKSVDVFMAIRQHLEAITVPGSTNGQMLRWGELCRLECSSNDNVINKILRSNSKVSLTYPETFISLPGFDNNVSRLFLGLAIGDMDGAIAKANALSMNLHLRTNYKSVVLEQWKSAFTEELAADRSHAAANASLNLYWWSYKDFLDTVTTTLTESHKWLGASAIAIVFLCIVCSFASNGYQSKPFLGAITGCMLLVSCVGGYSVQMAGIGGHLNALVFPICFILIGIGTLLLFTLAQCWSKYGNASAHPTEKIAFLLGWDAPCTLITALLLIACYLVSGATSGIPYLQYAFCVLAAGIAVLLIFTLLFYTVLLYIVGRRETKGVKWYQCCRTGDTQFTAPLLKEYSESGLAMLHEKLVDTKQSLRRRIGELMVAEGLRYPIVFLYTVYMIFAIWGLLMARIDLREEHFLPSNSESRKFLENYREMFGRYEEYLELVIDEPIDYHEPRLRQEIFDLIDSVIHNQYATRSVNWLSDFAKFEQSSIYDVNAETFVPVVHHIFLASDNFKRYSTDLIFDKFQTQILASRMYLELSAKGTHDRFFVVNDILNRAQRANIPLTVKAPFVFLLQHDIQVLRATVVAFAVGLSLIAVLSLCLFALPSLTMTVVIGDLSVIIGVVGYAVHWSIPINVLTVAMAISGNALTTAIIAHFCYHFANAGPRQKSGQKRVEYAFQSCLIPVTFACFFPVITYVPLLFAVVETPIVLYMWKMLVLTCVASFAHFLFILPGMMILFTELAPRCCSKLAGGCEQCCCYCCDMEEDSASIYYIPTTGRSIHADTMHRFNGSYPAIEHYSINGRRPVLMAVPPPGYLAIAAAPRPPTAATTVIVPDVLPYHRPNDTNDIYRGRRRRHSEQSEASSSQPELHTPRPLRRCDRMNNVIDEPRTPASGTTESIYEEPPNSENGRRPRRNSIGANNCAPPSSLPRIDRRTRPDRVSGMESRKTSNVSDHEYFDDRMQDREPAIEMAPNWRQYLIEGAIRHPGAVPLPVSGQPMLYYGAGPTVFAVPDYSSPGRDRRRY